MISAISLELWHNLMLLAQIAPEKLGYAKLTVFSSFSSPIILVLMILWSSVSGSLTRKQNTNTQFLSVLLGIFELTFSTAGFLTCRLTGQREPGAWWWLGGNWVSVLCMQPTSLAYHPPSLLVCCHKIIAWSCLKTNASSSSSKLMSVVLTEFFLSWRNFR